MKRKLRTQATITIKLITGIPNHVERVNSGTAISLGDSHIPEPRGRIIHGTGLANRALATRPNHSGTAISLILGEVGSFGDSHIPRGRGLPYP